MLYAAMRFVIAPIARLVYRPVVEGRENVPRHGAVIIASNHLSFIDSVVIPIADRHVEPAEDERRVAEPPQLLAEDARVGGHGAEPAVDRRPGGAGAGAADRA